MDTEDREKLCTAVGEWIAAGCVVHPAKADGSKTPIAVQYGSETVQADVFPDTLRGGRPHPHAGQPNPEAGQYRWGWKRVASGDLAPLTVDQVCGYIRGGKADGIGLILGKVSNGLEMIEVEGRAVPKLVALKATAERMGCGQLLERLANGCVELTPGGGWHFMLRISDSPVPGNTKFAARPDPDKPGEALVLSETRGQGGFVVVAPSSGRTHGTGNPYVMKRGGPATIPVFTKAERDQLAALFCTLDEMPPEQARTKRTEPAKRDEKPVEPVGRGRPSDDFNRRASWDDILIGWRRLHRDGPNQHWIRPGKEGDQTSATTHDAGMLYVFTTSTLLPEECAMSKFKAYTFLNYGGNYRAAGDALAAQGYGDPQAVESAKAGPPPEERRIEWEPVGDRGSRTQLVVVGVETGEVVDVDEIDVSRAHARGRYALRLLEEGLVHHDETSLKAELLRITKERCGIRREADQPVADVTSSGIVDCLDRWRRNTSPPRVPTGFGPIDRHLGGGLPIGVTAIAALPKVGKSCLAGQLVLGALLHDPELKAVWFRGEMSEDQLLCKFLATWSELRNPVIDPSTRRQAEGRGKAAAAAGVDMAQLDGRFWIIDSPLTPSKIISAVEALKPKLIVIDYLQKVLPDTGQTQRSDKRHEIEDTTAKISSLTLERGLATVVIASLPKNVTEDSGIGTLSKDSNLLDYDVNVFATLWKRDDGTTLFRINANRDGPEEDELLSFDGNYQFFRTAGAEPYSELSTGAEGYA